MPKLELLRNLSFGARVAEEETAELAKYFVETDQWNRIFRGEIDIIQGDKGAGKSAIYSLLVAKTNELFDKNILLITAEQPRGATVFRDLVSDPPTSENEFISLWKLYI
jgi:predicted ATP-dependent serine protease